METKYDLTIAWYYTDRVGEHTYENITMATAMEHCADAIEEHAEHLTKMQLTPRDTDDDSPVMDIKFA